MRATNSLARWGLAACLVVSGGLQAQDTGFSSDFKMRLGYTTTPKDSLRSNYQGFGFNVGYGLGAGRIGLELGYLYKTGDWYYTRSDDSKMATGNLPVDWSKAVEEKRNELSGFTIRLSWTQKLSEELNWQAGLQVGPQFKHQYIGDVRSTGTAGTAGTWQDTYQGVPREGGFSNVSPYGGVTWNIDKDSSLEFNLMLLRYTALEYQHYAGSGTYYTTMNPRLSAPGSFSQDTLDKRSSMVPHLEIAYVFHF